MFSRVSISVDYLISFTPSTSSQSSFDSRTVVSFVDFTELWSRVKMLVWRKKSAVVQISS